MSTNQNSNNIYRFFFRTFAIVCGVILMVNILQAEEALMFEEIPGLYQRILTLPGAKIRQQPEKTALLIPNGHHPPVFTPMYVYQVKKQNGNGPTWLACGKKPKNGSLGWIQKDYTEVWNTQLVLELIPRDHRNRSERVVFYKNWPTINQIMQQKDVANLAKNDLNMIDAGAHDPQRLVALEPDIMPDSRTKAHFMPVIDYKRGGFHRSYKIKKGEGVAFEVSMLNLQDNKISETAGSKSQAPNGEEPQSNLKKYKIGIVFLMDTTISMGNYIKLTYKTVETIYSKLKKNNAIDNVSFGLVGYRDYTEYDSGIEYVTKIYQPLDSGMKPETVLKNLLNVKPCKVRTDGFKEDMYAGLNVVVNELDWEPFDGKFIILVTDASAREPGDPHSKLNKETYAQLKFTMHEKGFQVYPLHVMTTAAVNKNDFMRGQEQFNDPERSEFQNILESAISGEDTRAFEKTIGQFANGITTGVEQAIQGEMANKKNVDQGEPDTYEDLVINEIFKTQLKFLGRQTGIEPPAYFHGWVSRIDLTRPASNHYVVTGKYLLTRNQLNDLAKRIHDLLEIFDDVDSEAFRRNMLDMSVKYSTDPNLDAVNLIGDTGILPAYLNNLPYQSKVMNMTAEIWSSYSEDKQQMFRAGLKEKISIYDMLNRDIESWIDLGEGEKVYPVPLAYFP